MVVLLCSPPYQVEAGGAQGGGEYAKQEIRQGAFCISSSVHAIGRVPICTRENKFPFQASHFFVVAPLPASWRAGRARGGRIVALNETDPATQHGGKRAASNGEVILL